MSVSEIPFAIAELLPQSGDMVLLDRVLEVDEGSIVTELIVRPDTLFFSAQDAGIPAWVGIEFMAQTVAAYSGYWRKRRGKTIDLGFLLGSRCYESSVDTFPGGSKLRVRAKKEIEGYNGMAVFDCRIEGGNIQASAKLNVLLPEDSRTFLTERAS